MSAEEMEMVNRGDRAFVRTGGSVADAQVTVITTEDVTAVGVCLMPMEAPSVMAQGAAKKHPKDEPDLAIGEALAFARALRDMADWYEEWADDQIDARIPFLVWGGPIGGHFEDYLRLNLKHGQMTVALNPEDQTRSVSSWRDSAYRGSVDDPQ